MSKTKLTKDVRGKGTRHKILVAVAATTVGIFLAELACRALIPTAPTIRFEQDVSELQTMQLGEAAAMIEDHPELFWQLVPNTRLPDSSWPFFGIISNGQSIREARDIHKKKPKNEVRILFLGDSCTFGYGVAQDRTFVEITERLLQEKYDVPVECINAGVPGYTLFQGYRYLATQGLDYQPDLVVLNFGWNDYGMWDKVSDAAHYARSKAERPPPLLRRSRLCQLIWALPGKGDRIDDGQPARPRLVPAEFANTLRQAREMANGVPLLVLVWPMRANAMPDANPDARTSLQKEMVSFGQQHPLSASPQVSGVLDLVPLGRTLVEQHGASALYFDHGHFKPIGHQAVAEAIADHLEPWLKQ